MTTFVLTEQTFVCKLHRTQEKKDSKLPDVDACPFCLSSSNERG